MRYRFETVSGRSFDVDCDPRETIQGIIVRAALDRGYDKALSTLEWRGEALDPSKTLSEYDIQPEGRSAAAGGASAPSAPSSVIVLRGDKRAPAVTEADAEADAIEEAEEDRKQSNSAIISLEKLQEELQQDKEDQARPKFVSRAERERRALQRREDVAAKRRERLQEVERERAAMLRGARRRQQGGGDLSAQERLKKTEQLLERASGQQQEYRASMTQRQELEQIRQKYLGRRREKKFIPKPAERFVKFTFDWAEEDDTSADINPLYARPHEAQTMFGRGFRAGIDAREQAKNKIVYEEEVEQREAGRAAELLQARRGRKERRAAAKRQRAAGGAACGDDSSGGEEAAAAAPKRAKDGSDD